MSKFLIDILYELTKKVEEISRLIQNQIVDPMTVFVDNQALTNKMLLRDSEEIIYSLEANNEFLKELSKNYDINSKNNQTIEQTEFDQIY